MNKEVINFGNYVKNLREEKGKTLKDVSDKSGGVSISHIFRIEDGKRKIGSISISTIVKLSHGLEVKPLVLLEIACNEVERDFVYKNK